MKEDSPFYSNKTFETKTISLDAITFLLKQEVPEHILRNTEITQVYEHMTRGITYFIRTNVLGQLKKESYKVEFKMPKNWWWHLMSNFTDKFKTKTIVKEVRIDHTALFPDIQLMSNEVRVVYKDIIIENDD